MWVTVPIDVPNIPTDIANIQLVYVGFAQARSNYTFKYQRVPLCCIVWRARPFTGGGRVWCHACFSSYVTPVNEIRSDYVMLCECYATLVKIYHLIGERVPLC